MGSVIRIAKEATHGQVGSTWTTIPCAWKGRLLHENKLPAEARAGQDVNFTVIQGLQSEEWEVSESPIYHDTFGIILGMAMGAGSKVAVGGETVVWDFVYKFVDDPWSCSVQWDQPHRSTQPFQVLYAVVDELVISFDVNGDLTFTAKGVAMPETSASAPAYSFSTVRAFAGWSAFVTKGGAAFARLLKGKLTIKRNRKPFFAYSGTVASASPTKMTIGDRTIETDLVCDFEAITEYNDWKAGTTTAYEIKFSDDGVTIGNAVHPGLTLRVGTAGISEAEIDPDTDLPSINLKGAGLYNTGDASSFVVTLRTTKDYTTL